MLRLWEVESGQPRLLDGHAVAKMPAAFSPDGRHIVSSSRDSTLRLWEVESRQSRRLGGHTQAVEAVAFFPDGRHIVSSSSNTLQLWAVADGRELARFDGDYRFRHLALAPDGKSLAAGDYGVHLLDILLDASDKAAWLARPAAAKPLRFAAGSSSLANK